MSVEGTTTPKAQDTVRCERFVVGSRQHSCIGSPAPLAPSHLPCAPAALRPSSIACAAWSCGTASPSHVTRKVQDLCVVCEFGNRDQVLSMIKNPDVKKGGQQKLYSNAARKADRQNWWKEEDNSGLSRCSSHDTSSNWRSTQKQNWRLFTKKHACIGCAFSETPAAAKKKDSLKRNYLF